MGIVCDTIGLGPYEMLIFLQPFNLLQTIPHWGGGQGVQFQMLDAREGGVGGGALETGYQEEPGVLGTK